MKLVEMLEVAMKSLSVRAQNFNSDVYLVALYLIPAYRKIATSKIGIKTMHQKLGTTIQKWNRNVTISEAQEINVAIDIYAKNVHQSISDQQITY